MLIAVAIPINIELPSSNSICHPSSPRKANEDDKLIFYLYTQLRHMKILTHATEPMLLC